jgi:hypothetical protein
VLSHEFTHYVHSISTFHGVDDLQSLIFHVHAGIQRLEELARLARLPLRKWADERDGPEFVKSFVNGTLARQVKIHRSMGWNIDQSPPNSLPDGSIYKHGETHFIRMTATAGVPIQRLALMRGAAVIKKCEAVRDTDDLERKKDGGLWHKALELTPANHKMKNQESWGFVALQSALKAVEKRQKSPLSLIGPVYLGEDLLALANEIGSPVVLTSLAARESPGTYNPVNVVRTISDLCAWLIYGDSAFKCPYAGCPGCPDERAGPNCRTDARKVIALPDDVPWCGLFFSAKQLRVDLVRLDLASSTA